MLTIIGLYFAADVWLHKGIARVLLPKDFPAHNIDPDQPVNKNTLANEGKEWIQAVNTTEQMNRLSGKITGLECDVYFNTQKKIFEVHHDPGRSTGLGLESLLQAYTEKKLTASVWLDFKNLEKENQQPSLSELTRLRGKFGLNGKLLVESAEAGLLSSFSDSGFYTSYYTPLFNPYIIGEDEIKKWVDSLTSVISHSKVDALSGYYFQYRFLHHYFPNYPVLIWAADDRFSMVTGIFKRKIASAKEVFIVLYPR